jgi:hypothetical protein
VFDHPPFSGLVRRWIAVRCHESVPQHGFPTRAFVVGTGWKPVLRSAHNLAFQVRDDERKPDPADHREDAVEKSHRRARPGYATFGSTGANTRVPHAGQNVSPPRTALLQFSRGHFPRSALGIGT